MLFKMHAAQIEADFEQQSKANQLTLQQRKLEQLIGLQARHITIERRTSPTPSPAQASHAELTQTLAQWPSPSWLCI